MLSQITAIITTDSLKRSTVRTRCSERRSVARLRISAAMFSSRAVAAMR